MRNDNYKVLALEHVEHLRQFAIEKGITQQTIADLTGFKQTNVERMLSGKYVPRYDNFLTLCDAIGIKISLID